MLAMERDQSVSILKALWRHRSQKLVDNFCSGSKRDGLRKFHSFGARKTEWVATLRG